MNNKETMTDNEKRFDYHSYTKGELAMLYIPDVLQQSAVNQFNKWLYHYPGLVEKLEKCGWNSLQRRYTPEQVRIIVSAFSEP